jgi:hypothetical protein
MGGVSGRGQAVNTIESTAIKMKAARRESLEWIRANAIKASFTALPNTRKGDYQPYTPALGT